MTNTRDRILLVENDPVVSDLIGRQALQASGYQVVAVSEASAAISKALQWAPDLIITDLDLPGLSGKDLMVALTSQGSQTPVIILAQRGMEADIIQTFRLGASDYLLLPVREAEVIAAVGRVLQQVHDRRERERLSAQLTQANQELQARVRELTTIFAVGKAVTSITDQAALLDKVLEGAMRVTQADLGWFLLREEGENSPFLLVADHGLPPSLGTRKNAPWDDGISSLVAMSGEPLTIHGEPLKRFKIAVLGGSALIVPIKAQQKRVMGLLTMMRKPASPFTPSEQHLLEALADYAAISLVNARLFKTVEERARSLQQMAESITLGDKINIEILEVAKRELSGAVSTSLASLERLAKDPTTRWRPDQRQLLVTMQEQLMIMHHLAASIIPHRIRSVGKERTLSALNEQVKMAVGRLQTYAQHNGMSVVTEIPQEAVIICVENSVTSQVLDGLLSMIIRASSQGALISVKMQKEAEQAHLTLRTSGLTIDPKEMEKAFDQPEKAFPPGSRFSGLGIRPNLVREIVTTESGKIWLESLSGKEAQIHLTLPLMH